MDVPAVTTTEPLNVFADVLVPAVPNVVTAPPLFEYWTVKVQLPELTAVFQVMLDNVKLWVASAVIVTL